MDRIYAIATYKPLRIREAEIIVPPLTFKDFEIQPIRTEMDSLQGISSFMDCAEQVMQADMFMARKYHYPHQHGILSWHQAGSRPGTMLEPTQLPRITSSL
jgi:hypothetical protein